MAQERTKTFERSVGLIERFPQLKSAISANGSTRCISRRYYVLRAAEWIQQLPRSVNNLRDHHLIETVTTTTSRVVALPRNQSSIRSTWTLRLRSGQARKSARPHTIPLWGYSSAHERAGRENYYGRKNYSQMNSQMDRRTFLGSTVAAGGALLASTALSYGKILGANDRISLGHIGTGSRGGDLSFIAGKLKDSHHVEMTTVCDLWKVNREKAAARDGESVRTRSAGSATS